MLGHWTDGTYVRTWRSVLKVSIRPQENNYRQDGDSYLGTVQSKTEEKKAGVLPTSCSEGCLLIRFHKPPHKTGGSTGPLHLSFPGNKQPWKLSLYTDTLIFSSLDPESDTTDFGSMCHVSMQD